jgi:hypothetical protein
MSTSKKKSPDIKVTKGQLIADLRCLADKNNGKVSRGFYRANGSFGKTDSVWNWAFSEWPDFVTAAGLVGTSKSKSAEPLLSIEDQVKIEKEKILSKTSNIKQKYEHAIKELNRLETEFAAAMDFKSHTPDLIIIEPKLPSGKSESVAVVLLSDWHCEETVILEHTSGRNEFNLEICKERVLRCFEGIRRLWEINNRDTRIKTLILALLGDFITGSIHADLAERNKLPPVEALCFAQTLIYNGIKFLLENTDLEEILIPCHSGNHGRATKEQRHATEAGNSFEQYMYLTLRELFADEPRVKFLVSEGYLSYINVFGTYPIRFHHGHNLKYQGGIGGPTVPINKAVDKWNRLRRVQLDCFGHFHQRIDGGNFILNGSVIGYTAYSTAIHAVYERPAQMFFLINKKFNEKTITAPIFVSEEKGQL